MNGPRRRPSNMSGICRLCLTEDELISPIFGEEDSSSETQIPLPIRIMACVAVEVSMSDGLPKMICEKCLYHVNSWHEFKQICEVSQATLKEWQNAKENTPFGEKEIIIIKQEPEDSEPEEDVMEITDDNVSNQFMVEDIKQEVDMYDEDEQDSVSIEAVEDCMDPLGIIVACSSNTITKDVDVDDVDVEVVPQTAGDVSHLQITDIKTECGDVIPVGEVAAEPSEGRLLRSVLQGKTKIGMYSKRAPTSVEEKGSFQSVKPFLCRLCDKSFSYNYLLKRHEKTHKGDRNVCSYCQKGFSSHASLVQHVRFFNGTTSTPYTCDHCQQEFECRTQYLTHADGSDESGCSIALAGKDLSQEIEELQEQSAQCEVCYEKFPSQMLLRLHMRKEHLHYSCHKCDKSYTNGVALSNHLRSHSLGGMRHHCESCTRTFPTYELLKKHERTHMKENAAMTIIPAEVVSKSSECDPQEETDMTLPEIALFLDRPIKEEPPDTPEDIQDVQQQQQLFMENTVFQQSHVCHLCNEHFPTIASLRFHLKGVHLHYQCHRCPKVYSSGVALSNHLRSHTLSTFKKHKCLVCLKSFSTIDLLSKHKKTHSAPAGLAVKSRKLNNSYPSSTEQDLDISALENNEIEDESTNEPLARRTCSVCNLVAASPSALGRHMACHTRDKMYTCSICYVSMSYASSLHKHYRLIHNKHIELRTIQKSALVEMNDTDVALSEAQKQQQSSGRRETFTRSGRRIIFKKTFKMTTQLQHAQLPTPYECKVCHRSFAYRSFLLKHSKVHCNPNSSVSCPICQKTFPDAKTLNNHKGVHTRFKHFTCNICGKSFNGLNAWQKHERMHQKGFIYSCKLCGKKFLSKAELHEHKKMHIKVKIYTCAVCKNSYHSSSALGKHKRRHGHWYASPENSDASDVEIINGYDLTVSNTPTLKAPVSKTPVVVKQSVPKSLIASSAVKKAHIPRNVTHFPSGKRRPYCSICHKTFSHMSALRKHKRLHLRAPATPEQKPLPSIVTTEENACLTCNRTFPDHVSLVRHKGWHTRRGTVISPEPTNVPAPGKLPINPCFVKAEPASVNPYRCSQCKKTFTTGAALASHERAHTEANRRAAAAAAAAAATSAAAATVAVESSKVNANGYTGEILTSTRRLACKICKKPFESKKALITHIGWHSRGSQANKRSFNLFYVPKGTPKITSVDVFSCNVCHKIFSSAVILSKHKKLHTRKLLSSIKDKSGEILEPHSGGARYSCSVCHRTFKLEKYMLLHMRLHTGEKRFKCHLCPQAYHRSGSLWKHKRTHHNVKVFSCPICQKRFGLKNQLTKHVETHQPTVDFSNTDTVFACSRCDKTFPSLAKFKQHEKVHI